MYVTCLNLQKYSTEDYLQQSFKLKLQSKFSIQEIKMQFTFKLDQKEVNLQDTSNYKVKPILDMS